MTLRRARPKKQHSEVSVACEFTIYKEVCISIVLLSLYNLCTQLVEPVLLCKVAAAVEQLPKLSSAISAQQPMEPRPQRPAAGLRGIDSLILPGGGPQLADAAQSLGQSNVSFDGRTRANPGPVFDTVLFS